MDAEQGSVVHFGTHLKNVVQQYAPKVTPLFINARRKSVAKFFLYKKPGN